MLKKKEQITTICQSENNELIWRNTIGKIKNDKQMTRRKISIFI